MVFLKTLQILPMKTRLLPLRDGFVAYEERNGGQTTFHERPQLSERHLFLKPTRWAAARIEAFHNIVDSKGGKDGKNNF